MTVKGIAPGMQSEAWLEVTPELTAPHIGSGSLTVYATPAMVALVERTCALMLAPQLPEDQTSVGVEVRVSHLAPTPVGGKVHIRAEIVSVEDGQVNFRADIWDEVEKVGEAEHKRFIIDIQRFLHRVNSKISN